MGVWQLGHWGAGFDVNCTAAERPAFGADPATGSRNSELSRSPSINSMFLPAANFFASAVKRPDVTT
jgi:hypothetical protein